MEWDWNCQGEVKYSAEIQPNVKKEKQPNVRVKYNQMKKKNTTTGKKSDIN